MNPLALLPICSLLVLSATSAQEKPKNPPATEEGLWEMDLGKGVKAQKWCTGNRYMVVWIRTKDGKIVSSHGGTFKLEGEKKTTKVEYSTKDGHPGQINRWRVTYGDGFHTQVRTTGDDTETWKKVKE